ncbi:MAG: nucleotidyltransferase family protein [Lachnospiraceae bacterium]
MVSEAKKKAQLRYDKYNTRQIILKLNTKTDADIIGKLDNAGNKQGYLKDLVRANLRGDTGVLSLDSIKLLILPVAKRNALDSISLFGSYARNEARPESDVDLLIDGGNYNGLFGFMDIKEQFEEALKKKVDLISRTALEENKTEAGLLFRRNVNRDERVVYVR